MKRLFFLLICTFLFNTVQAQEVNVEPYSQNGRKGFEVTLQGEPQTVNDFIPTFFKGSGKTRLKGDIYTITAVSRADFPYPEVLLYSEVKNKNKTARAIVWMEDSLMKKDQYAKKLQELWYSFGIEYYRSLVQKSIDESNQALRFAERQYQKLDKDSLNLKKDIENNRAEKIKLEEALKSNDLNYKVLLQKIENNAYTKDSVAVAIDKIRRLIELQEKQKSAIQ